MRIGIDATPITNRSGTGYYTQKLIEFLGRVDGENEYVLFCPSGYREHLEHRAMFEYPNMHVVEVREAGQAAQAAWRQFVLPRQMKRFSLEVFHFPSFISSLMARAPSVLTIHDLCFSLYPETFSAPKRYYYRYVIPRSARRCAFIIADSDSTRDDILKYLHRDGETVRTVYLGVDPVRFYHVTDRTERERVRRRYDLPDHYILYIGTLEPRKNIVRLIRAFNYGVVSKGLPHHLVIAGRKGWLFEEIFVEVRALNLSGRVHFPGFVERSDLAVVYSMARAFAYPSLYEGFGLPCLEAMSCGTPVTASNTSSLPEILGEDALLVDPLSVDSIAGALQRLCSDEACHKDLSERGPRRASRYSWMTTARQTAEIYARTLREAR
ncbi:MAG: glycosyltransferase family 1 protein [Candidatus Abyssubacteria bacterium]